MIVRHFDLVGITILPPEAHSPLIIDADAVLSYAIARKSLQPIRRRDTQIIQPFSGIKLNQFTPSQTMQFRRKMAQFEFRQK
jgi:hypothetical protein